MLLCNSVTVCMDVAIWCWWKVAEGGGWWQRRRAKCLCWLKRIAQLQLLCSSSSLLRWFPRPTWPWYSSCASKRFYCLLLATARKPATCTGTQQILCKFCEKTKKKTQKKKRKEIIKEFFFFFFHLFILLHDHMCRLYNIYHKLFVRLQNYSRVSKRRGIYSLTRLWSRLDAIKL